ncbi:hypothetical protein [Novosphingobium rosa]|uniref:hypothetical protein n=1 Tax=Novosphingobium rosa TaxID=76978 RepID=UPI000AF7D4D1|nr:hypothetical protein [Novosphingobium rosa]
MAGLARSEALVLCLCASGDSAATQALAQPWTLLAPRSAFAVIELDLPLSETARQQALALIADGMALRGLSVPHLVLVGQGDAASAALDLALGGGLAGVGAILIDLPPQAPRHRTDQTRSVFRFVQHPAPGTPHSVHVDQTLHALRQDGHDIRTIALPDAPEPTGRAIGAFLVELVARASRHHAIARPSGAALPSKDRS